MEENLYSQEMIDILEEIQINSYNLNQQFIKLNEEILQADSTTGSGIKINHIEKTSITNNLIAALLIMSITFSFIKLRGERNLWV